MRLLRLLSHLLIAGAMGLAAAWVIWRADLKMPAARPVSLTERERQFGQNVRPAIRAFLENPIDSPGIQNATFSDLIDRLRDRTKLNIFVNWRAVEAEGISRQGRISVDWTNARIADAILRTLEAAGTEKTKLTCLFDGDILTISSSEELHQRIAIAVYDVRDLLGPSLTNPKPEPAPWTAAELERHIVSTVAPETWLATGGRVGSARMLSGQIIVTQSNVNQIEIRQLLYDLRLRRRLYAFAVKSAALMGSLLVAVLLAHVTTRAVLLRRRLKENFCRHCGYDLRATPDRCPECGKMKKQEQQVLTPAGPAPLT